MQQQSIDFLEANKHYYDILISAGYVRHFDIATRQGMLDVIHREFDAGYNVTMWCSECVLNMLKFVYQQYELKKVK